MSRVLLPTGRDVFHTSWTPYVSATSGHPPCSASSVAKARTIMSRALPNMQPAPHHGEGAINRRCKQHYLLRYCIIDTVHPVWQAWHARPGYGTDAFHERGVGCAGTLQPVALQTAILDRLRRPVAGIQRRHDHRSSSALPAVISSTAVRRERRAGGWGDRP
jgi:hypothetical protein